MRTSEEEGGALLQSSRCTAVPVVAGQGMKSWQLYVRIHDVDASWPQRTTVDAASARSTRTGRKAGRETFSSSRALALDRPAEGTSAVGWAVTNVCTHA